MKKPLEIYAVKIKARTGRQANNRNWPIGAYLKYRPEQVEDVHGPGGWATYDPVVDISNATFEDKQGADGVIRFMQRRYAGVECELIKFVETT